MNIKELAKLLATLPQALPVTVRFDAQHEAAGWDSARSFHYRGELRSQDLDLVWDGDTNTVSFEIGVRENPNTWP